MGTASDMGMGQPCWGHPWHLILSPGGNPMQTVSRHPTSPEQIIFQLILFRAKLGNNPTPRKPGTPLP